MVFLNTKSTVESSRPGQRNLISVHMSSYDNEVPAGLVFIHSTISIAILIGCKLPSCCSSALDVLAVFVGHGIVVLFGAPLCRPTRSEQSYVNTYLLDGHPLTTHAVANNLGRFHSFAPSF